ncbi:Transcription factor-like protein DPB [Dichanthelium oligosanthes]|uniref:Transcription factor-like protein DPB n=1 Tax=Dichanthelium oligosanthes TaxID=888268 RepID=A0A1E5VJQ9_9POAL|nr:Transcription factor-like protein DPB [Dichanthelium oligosanthes]
MVSGAGPSGGPAHSGSTGAGGGSPSDRGGAAPSASASVSTPASESTVARRLNGLDLQADDAPSSQPAVADELVAEFSDPNINIDSPDPDNPSAQQYDEKNIRRRVYDALNVLMAMGIISKDKKEIQWIGLPKTSMNDIEELKTEIVGLKGRIDKKSAYLQDLQDQTRPHATVEVEISEDMQLVHFDFNSTPFELQDDSFVLKAMGLSGKEETDGTQAPVANGGECSSTLNNYWHQSPQPARSRVLLPNSPPVPGILKGRVKHEH